MQKTGFILLLILMASMSPVVLRGQKITLLSYNIKNDYQKEGVNIWSNRREKMVDLLQYYEPHIFGVQEALANQIEYLDSGLTKYSYVGVGRDDGQKGGEYCAIFYDSTQYKVIQEATFWLSETSDKASVGWDAAYPRICTFGLFENRFTKRKLWVLNTHFDHIGTTAREESARLILKQIKLLNTDNYPLVLTGDFNAVSEEVSIQLLKDELADGLAKSQKPLYGPVGTFNGFNADVSKRRIDYFFVKNLEVKSYVHLDCRRDNNLFISDHLPVLMVVEI